MPLRHYLERSCGESLIPSCHPHRHGHQYDAGTGTNPKGHLTNAWNSARVFWHMLAFAGVLHQPQVVPQLRRRRKAAQRDTTNLHRGDLLRANSLSSLDELRSGWGNTTTLTNSVGANNQPLTLTNYFDVASRPCLTTMASPSNSFTALASPNLFQVTPGTSTPGYSPAGGLQNYYLGSTASNALSSCTASPTSPVNVALGYNKRFWVSSIPPQLDRFLK